MLQVLIGCVLYRTLLVLPSRFHGADLIVHGEWSRRALFRRLRAQVRRLLERRQ
jgi:hypothetical protein